MTNDFGMTNVECRMNNEGMLPVESLRVERSIIEFGGASLLRRKGYEGQERLPQLFILQLSFYIPSADLMLG